MSEKEKKSYAKQAIRTYAPVEIGTREAAEEVKDAIDERGFLGTTFELEGVWFAQAA